MTVVGPSCRIAPTSGDHRTRWQDRRMRSDGQSLTFSDGTVRLRPWSSGDAGFLVEAMTDPGIRRYNGSHDRQGFPAPPLSTTDAEALIQGFEENHRAFAAGGDPSGVAFAVVDVASGELVGCCGVDGWSGEDVAQFGYWIVPSARGRGHATRAATLLTRWLFELGAARILLTIVAGNEESAAVARRAGFVYEGTMRSQGVWLGRRCDVMLFAAVALEWGGHEATEST